MTDITLSGSILATKENKMDPKFYPFIKACKAHGIGKTAAYKILEENLVETFMVGPRRYVVLESLYALPQKIKNNETV